jgi:Uma2 family endonuclease
MSAVLESLGKNRSQAFDWTRPRRFTVHEYYRMLEVGILREDDRVELIQGEILPMSPKSISQVAGVRRTSKRLEKILGRRAFIRAQEPIHLDDSSEPEPDVVVAQPSETAYEDHHPTPVELYAVIEVADSSFAKDRDQKAPLYAEAGILQYCILNVRDRELEDYRDPSPRGYRSFRVYTARDRFNLVAFPEIEIKVADLLPRRAPLS